MLTLSSNLVQVDWLKNNLNHPNLVVLDATLPKVSSPLKLDAEVIPGALFCDIKHQFSDVNGHFPHTFPSEKQFQHAAQELGVNKDSVIIVYDAYGIYSSPRIWWLFKTFGHEKVAVLDGGLPNWKAVNLPLSKGYEMPKVRGNFMANLQEGKVCFFKDIEEMLSRSNRLILDARSANRFNGTEPEPRKGLRSGHIKSAKNLPYGMLMQDGRMKEIEALRSIFEEINVANEAMIFSCGSGITACILALGATLAGHEEITVYDGSWTEYGSLTKDD